MELLVAPYVAAALLLIVAGVAKAMEPLPLARALSAGGLGLRGPVLVPLVRVAALGEAVMGALAVVTPSALTAGLVCVSYAGFTGFGMLALRRGSPLASCGCFGGRHTPPSRIHVLTTASLAAVAGGVSQRPAALELTLALAGVIVVLTYLLYLLLAVLPRVTAARSS